MMRYNLIIWGFIGFFCFTKVKGQDLTGTEHDSLFRVNKVRVQTVFDSANKYAPVLLTIFDRQGRVTETKWFAQAGDLAADRTVYKYDPKGGLLEAKKYYGSIEGETVYFKLDSNHRVTEKTSHYVNGKVKTLTMVSYKPKVVKEFGYDSDGELEFVYVDYYDSLETVSKRVELDYTHGILNKKTEYVIHNELDSHGRVKLVRQTVNGREISKTAFKYYNNGLIHNAVYTQTGSTYKTVTSYRYEYYK